LWLGDHGQISNQASVRFGVTDYRELWASTPPAFGIAVDRSSRLDGSRKINNSPTLIGCATSNHFITLDPRDPPQLDVITRTFKRRHDGGFVCNVARRFHGLADGSTSTLK
jgi:hypothetical protein